MNVENTSFLYISIRQLQFFIFDNRHHTLLYLSPKITSPYFSYMIDETSKNKDDCTRDLAINATNGILQQQYHFRTIINTFAAMRPIHDSH